MLTGLTYEISNPNTAYDLFSNKIIEANLGACTTHKRNSKYKYPKHPWITTGILQSIKQKDKMYKELKNKPTNLYLNNKYKLYRNRLPNIIRTAKRNYYESEFQLHYNNAKETWKLINSAVSRNYRNNTIPIKLHLHKNNQMSVLTDQTAIANAFNQYYVNLDASTQNYNNSNNTNNVTHRAFL